MNIEEIKQRFDESVAGQVDSPPAWPVTKEKLIETLVTVGIDEETAKSMFTNTDPSLRILQEITQDNEDIQLVIRKGVADIAPWNNADEYNWRGYFEGGTIHLALILLVLCVKCYPLDLGTAWGENVHFYVNADWQKKQYGVTYSKEVTWR
ncbi:MAG TPA: hypothetical protein VFR47_26040 [Anaerolineales bacterium]|nr:hypothetical protein [Anaerolineales bacterium]